MEKFFGETLSRLEAEFKRAGYREKIPAGVENILVVRLDALGDMILTSGFLRELRKNFPRARITLICAPLARPIVELCPYVNEIFTFDRKSLDRNFFVMIEQLAAFARENLWQKNFSMVFSPQWGSWNLPALALCWLSGARERIGFDTNPYASWIGAPSAQESALDNFLLTRNFLTPQNVVAEVEKHFYLLEALGLAVEQTHTENFFGAADFLRARALLKISPACRKVILGIGAGLASRKYPVEKFLPALKILASKNLAFVLVGGQTELEDATYLEKNLPAGKILNFVGKTTLRETAAVIAQADYYVGTDSGVMHMVAAEKIPCLVLYREAADKENFLPGVLSEYRRFPPWQTNSVILRSDRQLDECARRGNIYGWCHEDAPHCIAQITPQEIVAGFETLATL